MTLIRRPSSSTDLVSLRDAMERLFDERLFRPTWLGNGDREAAPSLDLHTTPEAIVAKVVLPGVKPEEVDVTIGDDLVTISGSFNFKEEKETTEAGYVPKELSHGSLSRSFALPTAVKADAATASFKDGRLTLAIPETEEGQAEARQGPGLLTPECAETIESKNTRRRIPQSGAGTRRLSRPGGR